MARSADLSENTTEAEFSHGFGHKRKLRLSPRQKRKLRLSPRRCTEMTAAHRMQAFASAAGSAGVLHPLDGEAT